MERSATVKRQPASRKTCRRQRRWYRPTFELLEDRLALAPLADAGVDQDVDRGSAVVLDGSGSAGTGALTYTWTQRSGPDVTGGTGTLSGATPQFAAPSRVSTLEFDLVVADSTGLSN